MKTLYFLPQRLKSMFFPTFFEWQSDDKNFKKKKAHLHLHVFFKSDALYPTRSPDPINRSVQSMLDIVPSKLASFLC